MGSKIGTNFGSQFVFLGEFWPPNATIPSRNGHRNGPHRFQKSGCVAGLFWVPYFVNNWLDYDKRGANEKKEIRAKKIQTRGPNERDQNMSCFEALEMGLNVEVLRLEVDALGRWSRSYRYQTKPVHFCALVAQRGIQDC